MSTLMISTALLFLVIGYVLGSLNYKLNTLIKDLKTIDYKTIVNKLKTKDNNIYIKTIDNELTYYKPID